MRWYWLGVVPVALVLGAGCNSILGIDSAELTDAGSATGGSGGNDASSGGTAGSGGAGGTGGAAGSDAGGDASCTDTQTDANNCGWCGHVCGTGTCTAGLCAPETVAPLSQFAVRFVLTGDYAFVTGSSDDKLYRIPKAPGGKVESWTTAAGLYELAKNGNFIYFNEYDSMKLWSLDTTAALPLAPTQFATSNASIMGLVADDSGVYYFASGVDILRRVSLDGKTVVDWATNVYDAWYMVTDATDLYFGRVNDGIYRIAKNATPPVDANALSYVYDVPGDGPASLIMDGDSLYYSSGDPSGTFPVAQSEILQIGKDGTLKAKLATSTTLVVDMTIANGYLYWVEEGTLGQDFTDGAVRRVKLGDTTAKPETYATGQSHPVCILVDGGYVYWLNGGWTSVTGGLMRLKI